MMKYMLSSIPKSLCALVFLLAATGLWAQPPVPAPAQERGIALVGGTAHLGDGNVIANAVIAFDEGTLTVVADSTRVVDPERYQIIEIQGKHVYPGFILPTSTLGLVEVGALRATVDRRERGEFNPNVRSLIAYNTDSELIPTLRYNGILTAQITPTGGTISGTSSVVQLDAWNWEDAAYQVDDAIHLNWPNRFRRRFDFASGTVQTSENKNYAKDVEELQRLFDDALSYGRLGENKDTNLKLAAMQGLFDGGKALFLYPNDAKEIIESVTFAKRNKVQRVVVHGDSELWMAKDFLKEHQIPVIVANVHRRPSNEDEDIDFPYRMPGMLVEEGLLVGLAYGSGHMSARNLAFYAGTAAAHGMSREEALKCITSNTAQILGIGDRVGSLTVGKDATLFVSEGDALDMRTNLLTHAFIQGRQIILDGRQQELYERYKKKYGL